MCSLDRCTMTSYLNPWITASKRLVAAIESNPQESRKQWMLNRFAFAASNSNKNQNYMFWQAGNYVEDIETYNFYRQKLDYIHQNPVRREIVRKPEDYLYSSACDYAGIKGLLDIIVQP